MSLLRDIHEDLCFYASFSEFEGKFGAFFDRYFWVCANYRLGHWAHELRIPLVGPILRRVSMLSNFFVSAVTATDVKCSAVIGKRLNVHTTPGIIIGGKTRIGDDCVINSGVCLVRRANGTNQGPEIGNRVYLGMGCKVLGGVKVGDDAVIGANAVVLHDVPAGHMAVGIPAVVKPILRNKKEAVAAGTEALRDEALLNN